MNTPTTDRTHDADTTAIATGGVTATDPAGDNRLDTERDANGMTRDDRFDQLMDESRVVTGGTSSILPHAESGAGSSTTGYSSGVGSGSGSDN